MTVEIKAILDCNMGCANCYEERTFDAQGKPEAYSVERIIETMLQAPGDRITLHGGEPLLMPIADIQLIFKAARSAGKKISVMTNATLIRDEHVELFKAFKVSVGISLNGPDVLNRDRRLHDEATTDGATARIHMTIDRLLAEHISVGLICVLSRTNCGDDALLARLIEWARALCAKGVSSIRFNPMHDNNAAGVELSAERAAAVYIQLARETFSDPKLLWLPFREYADNLLGLGVQPCWSSPCDVFATSAVYAIFGNGSTGNCLRTAKDGTPYLRSGDALTTRQDILAQIPFDEGGCGGCRWFRVCQGGCPAEAVDDDWRNKSRFCEMYLRTYDYIKRVYKGLMPLIITIDEWTSNNEQGLMQSVRARTPKINAFAYMSQWSNRPSTYDKRANEKRKHHDK